ncbi:type II secretion system protein [Cerasicoccus arenae]|uniref:Prepilin-type N-terminal cleavage/methylation domain-containing protein n=1 Tax=Cerasicoccus arenae TaxID=424488 RepID=A0A8J3D9N1_9BACT|nr:type II secretion system protein [Cerasicoccus arenae]MBK1857072.1 type II secretion system protein [Cerasicoccus arenae]GHB92206.1 hypothetical protein GCM10007047_04060 [Cerasicoccus arenae]
MKARNAFTLVEILTVGTIVGILTAIMIPAVGRVRQSALTSQSVNNIRQLSMANLACLADTGHFVQSMSGNNRTHWYGKKKGKEYLPEGGYLIPYLQSGAVTRCPVFDQILGDSVNEDAQFNAGAGGYGYNSLYLGSSPQLSERGVSTWWTTPNVPANVPDPSKTVMFTSTAITNGEGIVEYGFSEPPFNLSGGKLAGRATPSVHFRFNGEALVAWADGRVSFESPSGDSKHNHWGADNEKAQIGWFGPEDFNGYWNPHFQDKRPY